MNIVNRRTFIGGSGALVLAGQTSWAAAAATCKTAFVPVSLSVDCASKRNYGEFRRYPERIALVGVVSVQYFKGKYGEYPGANLFLYPVLKPPPRPSSPTAPRLAPPPPPPAVLPTGRSTWTDASPLPVGHSEESFLGLLGTPSSNFIGFSINLPFDPSRARTPRFTNGKLPDGTEIGINWTVSNLNRSWFAGSPIIPHTDQCNGEKWRKAIIGGLKQVASQSC